MDVEITRPSGQKVRLSDINIVARDFIAKSPELHSAYSEVDGRNGTVDMGATYGRREIIVPFYLDAKDSHDIALLRDELYALVSTVEPIYIREMRQRSYNPTYVIDVEEPDRVVEYEDSYVGGKRFKVRLTSSPVEIEQMFTYGFGEIVFETVELPFAESIGTTADIDRDGISSNSELWGFGMGLLADDDSLVYTHTGTSFKIYNAGNVPIHPFEQRLKITIEDVAASYSYLELINVTTDTTFRVNEAVKQSQKIVLDGPNITINGLQAFTKTNKQYITLAPGWNYFTVKGTTSAKVSFVFPFYYL